YSFQNISTVADRFLYFPLIGVSLFAAFIYVESSKKTSAHLKIIKGFGLVYFLFFFTNTLHRTFLWSSNSYLLESSVDSGYKSYPLNLSLGVNYLKEKEYEKAIESFKQAYRLTIKNDVTNKAA